MEKFTIGCDPEIFLCDAAGSPKSAIGLIGGDKWKPRILTKDGHAVLEDNVAVEFNIPSCDSFDQFKTEVKRAMELVREIVPADLHFKYDSAISFPDSELACDAAWVFGCEPDFNAWLMCENESPSAEDKNLRSAGGHIHVGCSVAVRDPISVIRAMDLFLGVPSTQLDAGTLRRKLYGKAGAFRFKNYGVEYRSLSNFWIFDDSRIEWAYRGTEQALEFVESGKSIPESHAKLIQDCINNNNTKAYTELANHYRI